MGWRRKLYLLMGVMAVCGLLSQGEVLGSSHAGIPGPGAVSGPTPGGLPRETSPIPQGDAGRRGQVEVPDAGRPRPFSPLREPSQAEPHPPAAGVPDPQRPLPAGTEEQPAPPPAVPSNLMGVSPPSLRPAAEDTTLSPIERNFSEIISPDVPLRLRQYGYEVFRRQQPIPAAVEMERRILELRLIQAGLKPPPIRVLVAGEAMRPGVHELTPPATIMDALFAAEGPSTQGTMRALEVSRAGSLVGRVDLYGVLLEGDQTQNLPLHDRDTVFIPKIGRVVGIAGNVRRPGIYEMRDGLTLLELIELGGGISPFGYLQHIQVLRTQEHRQRMVVDVNLVDFFQKKHPTQQLGLQDGDLVHIFPISGQVENFVTLRGNVRRPGRYELKPGLQVRDLVALAEGLLPQTYMERAEIVRRMPPDNHPEVRAIDLRRALRDDPHHNSSLESQDEVTVFSVFEFQDRPTVEIRGAVRRPGVYPLLQRMKVGDLLFKAGGLSEDAYRDRALITRIAGQELTAEGELLPKFRWIDLKSALNGDRAGNVQLQGRDTLTVFSLTYFGRVPTVQVEGLVNNPGKYELLEDMRVSDLVMRAGGLAQGAYSLTAELTRIDAQNSAVRTRVIPLNLDAVLNGGADQDRPLQAMDILFVRQRPEWHTQRVVTLEGELVFPGQYVIRAGERLSSVIQRAGGFTGRAFSQGAVFTRQTVQQEQGRQLQEILELARMETLKLEVEAAGGELDPQREPRRIALQARRQLLELLAAKQPTGRMVVQVHDPDQMEGTPHDLELQAGDRLFIPPVPSSVSVIGGVFNPGAVAFKEGEGVEYYLNKVGGLTELAVAKEVRLIKADGTVVQLGKRGQGNGFGRGRYFAGGMSQGGSGERRIEAGDALFVPVKFQEDVRVVATTQSLIDIIFKTAVSIGAMVALF